MLAAEELVLVEPPPDPVPLPLPPDVAGEDDGLSAGCAVAENSLSMSAGLITSQRALSLV